MKKIGIITHHYASNFGANLQTLSTFEHLKRKGYQPLVIDWRSESLDKNFRSSVPEGQLKEHESFVRERLSLTRKCYGAEEVAKAIYENDIEAVIIGSDAVVQHWPLLSRIAFPTRKIVSVYHFTSDRMFPNQFWGDFVPYLEKPVKLAYMSVSSQNSPYKYIVGETKRRMSVAIAHFDYISVRDDWTQRMFRYLNPKVGNVPITPDPVFSFNTNAGHLVPSFEEIKRKYGMPEKYFLSCFFANDTIDGKWIEKFTKKSEDAGYECFSFPLPTGPYTHDGLKTIKYPLPPLDWYALIKYSSGFVGRNMHPIVISLHNEVPCYSFDQYGTKKLNYFVNEKSSKIYHILGKAGLLDNRITFVNPLSKTPEVDFVLDKLLNKDKQKYHMFAENQQREYDEMMDNICKMIEE